MNEAKIIFLGTCNVGKTQLTQLLSGKKYEENTESTIACSYSHIQFAHDNVTFSLNIWDTCGHEKFESITKNYYRDTDIFLLVFSFDDNKSMDRLHYYIDLIKKELLPSNIIFIGNKSDLIDKKEAEIKIRKFQQNIEKIDYDLQKTSYLIVSAKQNYGIDKFIKTIHEHVIELYDDYYFKKNLEKYNNVSKKSVVNIANSFNVVKDLNNNRVINMDNMDSIAMIENENTKAQENCCVIF